jgi:hypothetical protein
VILLEVMDKLTVAYKAAVQTPVLEPSPEVVNNKRFVVVGSEGEDDDGATVDLTPSEMGPGTWTDELGAVICSAWAQTGGTDKAKMRAAAGADAEACVAAVLADPTFGGLLVAGNRATVSAIRYRAMQTEKGAFARFSWTVSYGHLNT